MIRALKIAAAAILSIGWAIPLSLSVQFLAEWNDQVARATEHLNSFPYVHASKQLAVVAEVWALVAIAFWIGWGAYIGFRKRVRP